MKKVTRAEFEKIVNAGISAIPERFLKLLNNVVVVIEKEPTKEQIKKFKLGHYWTLFGLYEGVPLSERGDHYTSVTPDKITIFQNPIEQEASSMKEMEEIVSNTVWHEIAHYFGLDEAEVRKADLRRKKDKRE